MQWIKIGEYTGFVRRSKRLLRLRKGGDDDEEMMMDTSEELQGIRNATRELNELYKDLQFVANVIMINKLWPLK